jgi:uncharacterized protein YigE (DUF2233 family)
MKKSFLILVLLGACSISFLIKFNDKDHRFYEHTVDSKKGKLKFYWKNEKNRPHGSIKNLKGALAVKGQKMIFATNGGMYQKDQSPQGLFIEKGVLKHKTNLVKKAFGNFYMQPNGVFLIDTNLVASVCVTDSVRDLSAIGYATQSGPMLIIDGKLHPKFMKGSANVHIRNAVGILPSGECLFVISKKKINFYDLAMYFKNKGCKNALYFDGFVSRMYQPKLGVKQTDGNFGVIICETN